MRFLRQVHAECVLELPRLTRTRLGLSLLLLGAALVWLNSRGLDRLSVALQAGALGAIVCASSTASRDSERAAFATALTHPTTPLAIVTGRWIATLLPATGLVIICTAGTAWSLGAAAAGILAAAAVGACALAAVLAFGNGAAVALFLFMAAAGAMAPERLVGLAHPGVARLAAASALELGPALWHYRDIVAGDAGAVFHALAWAGLGVLLASGVVARQRTAH